MTAGTTVRGAAQPAKTISAEATSPGILLACRQITHKVETVLYEENVFKSYAMNTSSVRRISTSSAP